MDRDSLVYKAKLAEQAERFDEMVSDMKEVAKQPQELTVEERNLLSVAYKNVIGSRRASWRVVTSIEQKGDPEKMTIIKDYKQKIETELVDICNDILGYVQRKTGEALTDAGSYDRGLFGPGHSAQPLVSYLAVFDTPLLLYSSRAIASDFR